MKNINEQKNKHWFDPIEMVKGWSFILSILFILFMSSSPVLAQTTNQIYIAQLALGQDSGVDCADAYALTWLNNPSNWTATPSAGLIGPGTTVHLCGSISSPITVQGSGTSASPITIYFEPNAIMSAPVWPTTQWDMGGAIQVYSKTHIILDGGSNGVIEATQSNSTSQQSSVGIMLSSVSYVEVRNFTINNMYVRTSSTDTVGAGAGIIVAGSNTNVNVHNNTISQGVSGIVVIYEGLVAHILLYENALSGNNNSISVGEADTNSSINDLQIYGNNITGSGSEWDSSSDTYHHNGIHVFAVATGDGITNLKIYGNYIHGNWGTNVTSWIFIEDGGSDQGIVSPMIYNNVLYYDGNGHIDDGLIFTRVSNTQILNNTLVGGGIVVSPDSSSAANIQIINNIIYTSSWIYDSGTGDYISSNNLINQNPAFVNLSGLNFQLTASSAAIGAGTNLSSYFTTDFAGNNRPSTGAWDIGAYQYPQTFYVYCGATGSGNGTEWSDAYTNLPASLIRGSTYVIAGSNSCTYPYHAFNDTESGTMPINIRKAEAILDSGVAGWQPGFATAQAAWVDPMQADPEVFSRAPMWSFCQGYYNVDGITGSTASTGPGGQGFLVQSPAPAYQGLIEISNNATGCSEGAKVFNNISIHHVELSGVQSYYQVPVTSCSYNSGIAAIGTSTPTWQQGWVPGDYISGFDITNSQYVITNQQIITGGSNSLTVATSTNPCVNTPVANIALEPGGSGAGSKAVGAAGFYVTGPSNSYNNIDLSYNYLHPNGHDIIDLMNATNTTIDHNYFTGNESNHESHGQAIQTQSTTGLTVSNNNFADVSGTAVLFNSGASAPTTSNNWNFYGNVIYQTGTNLSAGISALIEDQCNSGYAGGIVGMKVYNNTIANITGVDAGTVTGSTTGTCSTGWIVENNLWYNSIKAAMEDPDSTSYHDYNTLLNTPIAWGSTPSAHEYITNNGSADPFVSSTGNFQLSNPTGISYLTGGISISSPYNIDLDGNTRGTGGNWDIGAYQYVPSNYNLDISMAGNGTGTVTSSNPVINCGADGTLPPCMSNIASGSVVTLTATATSDTNSVFSGWSGACTNNTGTCAVTMDADQNVTANFSSGPVNGSCGAASETYLYQSTSFGSNALCKSGTPNPATVSFPVPGGMSTWTCVGSNGGLNSTCRAKRNPRAIVKLL